MSRPPVLVVPSSSAARAVGLLLLVLLALVAGSPPAGADSTTTGPGVVEGTVRDQDGAPVAGARVRVATTTSGPAEAGSFERDAVTDAAGRYRAEDVVLPTGYLFDDGRGLRVDADGYATEGVPGVLERLKAFDGAPVRADVVLRRRDVVLRGRLSVRGDASAVGGGVTATLATPPGVTPGPFDSWTGDVDADGRYAIRVPAGSFRVKAASRYGLPTWWPDLAEARPAPATRVASPGETVDGLDISMRPKLRETARDEFGDIHLGWGVDPSAGDPFSGPFGTYPRDTYRSITSPNGPAVGIGPLRTEAVVLPGLPADELLTVTGLGLPVEVPIHNTGDDVLWLDGVRVEGDLVLGSSCRFDLTDCAGRFVMPGETRTVVVTVLTVAYAPQYRSTLVVDSNAPVSRTPLVQRNVSAPGLGPGDPRLFDALIRYLPPGMQAGALLASAGRGGSAGRPPATGPAAVVVRRSTVRVAFPAAGRVDVRVDRRIAARGRSAARWSSVRSVRLRATRAGVRTARIRPLARGRYRIRATTRFGTGPAHRTTVVRTVTR